MHFPKGFLSNPPAFLAYSVKTANIHFINLIEARMKDPKANEPK